MGLRALRLEFVGWVSWSQFPPGAVLSRLSDPVRCPRVREQLQGDTRWAVLPMGTQLAQGAAVGWAFVKLSTCALQQIQQLLLLHHGHPGDAVHMELVAAWAGLSDFQLHYAFPLSQHHIPLRFVVDFQETGKKLPIWPQVKMRICPGLSAWPAESSGIFPLVSSGWEHIEAEVVVELWGTPLGHFSTSARGS